MSEKRIPYLCGGTFLILLLQSLKKDRRIRINDLDGAAAKDKSINDVTVLKGLVRTFYAFNEHLSDSTFTAHKNDYKLCQKNSTDWLRFENERLVCTYDSKVLEHFSEAMTEMDKFIDIYLDTGDGGKDLIRALLELIYLDESISDDDEFICGPNAQGISKRKLIEQRKHNARPFLLGVWHYIIKYRGTKNTYGADTVGMWLTHDASQAPYKYVGKLGEQFALDKEISFDKIDYSDVSDEEPEVVFEDDADTEEASKKTYEERTVNQILNTPAIINQHAEKIVNIGYVDHLEI